ncbi:unnamed protein product [Haemonchus placei]|uniref:Uncharacterized protein n=1 Tax=Haemonchus placei TaxID=6290 RepID=A0A3P7YH35_HAEPC|nr:unnamed protein product [Haemonchus placei]
MLMMVIGKPSIEEIGAKRSPCCFGGNPLIVIGDENNNMVPFSILVDTLAW